jgi:hypothetical protein
MRLAPFLKTVMAALGLAAVSFAQTSPALSVAPNPAPAGKQFLLYLQGLTADCYTTFARETVTVSGSRIDLYYTPVSIEFTGSVVDPVCPVSAAGAKDTTLLPASALPNLPTFPMPPLPAGKYAVWAYSVPACFFANPGCLIAPQGVSAGSLEVRNEGAISYSFEPASVPAGRAFDLHLLSYGFSCATIYENLVVQVDSGSIVLSFLDREPAGAVCPAIYKPYGPVFQLPALAAGTYQVKVNRLSLNAVADAGALAVTGTPLHKTWYLKEPAVLAGKAFRMQLLRDSLPTCVSFSNQTAAVSGNDISASFLMQEGRCAQISPVPLGPVFDLPALKVGIYPVRAYELLPCEVAVPMCVVDRMGPSIVDTLVVMQTLAAKLSDLRAGSPHVEVSGGVARFALPAGGRGIWRAELAALDGRVLNVTELAGNGGERVAIAVDRAPAHALSLLRLTSPEGAGIILPLTR